MSERVPDLHICITCRAGHEVHEGDTVAGQRLHDAIASLLGEAAPVTLRTVACLANCDRGCSAAITAPGKWSYLLGGLSDAVAADLLTYGAAYAASRNGTVMPSKRPASLASAVIGRLPGQDMP